MNLGKTASSIASFINGISDYDGVKILIDNKNTKYVEEITAVTLNNTKGMALVETLGWYGASNSGNDSNYTYIRSNGMFSSENSPAWKTRSYRPVIWN